MTTDIELPPLPYHEGAWRDDEILAYAHLAILADRASSAPAQGMVLVPREITEPMLEAWMAAETFEVAYRAMIAAAPGASTAGTEKT